MRLHDSLETADRRPRGRPHEPTTVPGRALGAGLTPDTVLSLQRSVGNASFTRLLAERVPGADCCGLVQRAPNDSHQSPRTVAGTRMLADELAHVVQQRERANAAPAGIAVAPPDRFAPSDQLLARARSTGYPPAGATLQRKFTFKKKEYSRGDKMPAIHSVSPSDLQQLADDEYDYGTITNAGSVTLALATYRTRHPVVVTQTALDQLYAGYRTVWNDNAFAEHDGKPVRVTFQLDSGQGKHDEQFASDKDARKKSGGQQMPWGSNYAELAQDVPAKLTRDRLNQIFAKREREALDYSVQRTAQSDGFHYEISARWASVSEGRHILVYYHCYPPY